MFTPFHVSHVMCHVSCVMCHVSCVRCQVSHFLLLLFRKSGGASWWRVCNQQGLPRLVLMEFHLIIFVTFSPGNFFDAKEHLFPIFVQDLLQEKNNQKSNLTRHILGLFYMGKCIYLIILNN